VCYSYPSAAASTAIHKLRYSHFVVTVAVLTLLR